MSNTVDKNMKILSIDKEKIKADAKGLNDVVCSLKQKGIYSKTLTGEHREKNIAILRKQFPLLSDNLPKLFQIILDHSDNFKMGLLNDMIDKVYTIGKDPNADIARIKIDVATMLSDAFFLKDPKDPKGPDEKK